MRSLYARIADLPLEIGGRKLESLEQTVPSGWTRRTTLVRLQGAGEEGLGEDVTWNDEEQRRLQQNTDLELAGSYTLDEFSHRLDEVPLFRQPPSRPDFSLYRRWAFESAALDLALRQAGKSLAEILDRSPEPLTFVISTGLGEPPSTRPLHDRLALYPDMRFKLDFAEGWTPALVAELASAGAVDTVDLKGLYHGDFTGPPPDAAGYRMVAEGLPEAWIEDPFLDGSTRDALSGHLDRITWDANIHSVSDIITLPFKPRCINIKPSRFGFLSELLRTYEYCRAQNIEMYAGGQFELGIGREQAQYLAALFHPHGPNDICPLAYNRPQLSDTLPTSPLSPATAGTGFRWQPPDS